MVDNNHYIFRTIKCWNKIIPMKQTLRLLISNCWKILFDGVAHAGGHLSKFLSKEKSGICLTVLTGLAACAEQNYKILKKLQTVFECCD